MLQILVTCQRMPAAGLKSVLMRRVLCTGEFMPTAVSMYSAIVDDPPDTGHRMQNGH